MADAKPDSKTDAKVDAKTDAKVDAKIAKPARADRGNAAESSDPAVHQALAEMQTAEMNDDDAAREAATAKLNELGFE